MLILNTNEDINAGRSGIGSASVLRYLAADTEVKTRSDAPHPEVSLALERWQAIHRELRNMEVVLSEAVRIYAEGRGPVPLQLVSEVTALRGQCAGYFAALIEAVKAQAT
jgi:hypothetical protein